MGVREESRWLRIRINEFPEDAMFTLLIDGVESLDFDDWPDNWGRPEVS